MKSVTEYISPWRVDLIKELATISEHSVESEMAYLIKMGLEYEMELLTRHKDGHHIFENELRRFIALKNADYEEPI